MPAVKRPRFTPEEVEQHAVSALVEAMYPVFYPVEQQDCAIQKRHHDQITEIATAAWRTFVKQA